MGHVLIFRFIRRIFLVIITFVLLRDYTKRFITIYDSVHFLFRKTCKGILNTLALSRAIEINRVTKMYP